MPNKKAERRQKTLLERTKRAKLHKDKLTRRAEFPEFVFDNKYADPDFAAIVCTAVGKFRFEELALFEKNIYKIMRKQGAKAALNTLSLAMIKARDKGADTPAAHLGDIIFTLNTGEIILNHISEEDRKRLFPQNDFRIFTIGKNIVVQCTSLVQVKTPK